MYTWMTITPYCFLTFFLVCLLFIMLTELYPLYLSILTLPLISSLILLIFGRFLSINLSLNLNLTFILVANFLIGILSQIFILLGKSVSFEIPIIFWCIFENIHLKISVIIDTLSITMLYVVLLVSSSVHLYSSNYMKNDPHLIKFMAYISLFTFFMLLLITANNFIQLFIGWEGVGLCSYLLINFWHTRIQANKAAIKAVIVNRIGDTSLSIGIFLIFIFFGTLNFSTLNLILQNLDFNSAELNLISLFLFIGAVGKSAQIGLHTWLPDAMEGPTPVSALIHAATMVTAGVFLIIRSSFFFHYSTKILPFVILIGSLTCLLGATTAILQNDIKKVIAYSTCSQLGYMVFACGLTCFNGSFFHLYTHAFFKALLFLTAGIIIHALDNEQDMRRMGNFKQTLPFSYTTILIGSLALMGFPFLSGYYSKEFILEFALSQYTITSQFGFWLGTFAAGCTSIYSIRVLFFTFYNTGNLSKISIKNAYDAPVIMQCALLPLILSSIFIGYLNHEAFSGFGSTLWSGPVEISNSYYHFYINSEFLPFYIKNIPLFFSFFSFALSSYFYILFIQNKKVHNYKNIYNFFNKKWYFDSLYTHYFLQYIFQTSYTVHHKIFDRGFFENIGTSGVVEDFSKISSYFKKMHDGLIYNSFLYTYYSVPFTLLFLSGFEVKIFWLLFFLYNVEQKLK